MAKKIPAHGIKNIRIEPADDGGFMTEVCHYPKPKAAGKDGKDGKDKGMGGMLISPFGYDGEVSKHVHSNPKDLGKFVSGLFPAAVANSKRGKSESQSSDGTNISTYEGGGDGENDEEY